MTKSSRHISYSFPEEQLNYRMAGRDGDFITLKTRLLETQAYQQRLIVITAIGGTGKTRLAAELAIKTPEFTDGVLWVNWREYNSSEATEADLTARLREHLDLPVDSNPDSIWIALADKKLLIVLDNAESVPFIHRPAIAKRLMRYPTRGGTRVVMTSRIAWDECGDFAYVHSLDQLDLTEAALVVKVMADYSGKGQALNDQEATLAQKAYRHPLLIKYAIGWLAHQRHTLNDVFKMLEKNNHPDLDKMLKDVLHDTLLQIENGYEQDGFEPRAANDFRRLLVCKGGFTEAAAHALIGEDSPSLGVLRRWNLLGETSGRYTVDPLAEAVLTSDSAAYPVHYEFYLALALQHDEAQDYLGLDMESENLAVAFTWAMGAGEYEQVYWLYNACEFFFSNRGRSEQSKIWLESVALQLEDHTDEYLKAAVQNSLGILYQNLPTGNRQDYLKRAIACYEKALDYITPQTAPMDYATTQNNLGNAYSELAVIEDRAENLRRAIECYQHALIYRTPQTVPMGYATTQNNLGNAYSRLASIEDHAENLRRAIECYQHALIYRTPQAAPMYYATTQNNLAAAYCKLADIEDRTENLPQAIECYEQALIYWTPQAAPMHYAATQANLGLVYKDLGETEKMCAAWREAEKYYRQVEYIQYADRVARWLAEAGC